MDNQGTLVGMTNCTLYGNTAVSDGGGLKTSGAALIVNSTITANLVTAGSSGVYGGGIDDQGVAARVFNTIVARNFRGPAGTSTADDVAGMAASLGLKIVTFQPFRDFEGMPEPQRTRTFTRAERKFDLMVELGQLSLAVREIGSVVDVIAVGAGGAIKTRGIGEFVGIE